MKKAGLSETIIGTKLATEEVNLDVSTDAILKLKKQGISDELISLMIQRSSAVKEEALTKEEQNKEEGLGVLTSIQNKGDELILNEKHKIIKGGEIQVYLPASKDFVFVKRKRSSWGRLLSGATDVAVSSVAAVGIASSNIQVMDGALKVMRGASAVKYGADALEKINKLDISKKAKEIAGKKMEVLGWDFTDDGYVIEAKHKRRKYLINLQEAIMTGEVRLVE